MKLLRRLFSNIPFRMKLLVSYLVLIIIPILFLGLYSYFQSKQFLQEQALRGIRDTVQTIAGSLDDKAERYQETIDSIVYHAGIQKIFNNDYTNLTNLSYDLNSYLDPSITTILGLNKEIEQLTIYTQNEMPEYGNYILSSGRVAEKSWYKQTISDFNAEWFLEDGALIVARKMPDIFQSRHPSVVYMEINFSRFFNVLQDASIEEYGVTVTARGGEVIYRSPSFQGENAGQGRFWVIEEPLPAPDWTIRYYIPLSSMSVDAANIIKATALIILICCSILFILIWIFSNSIIRPINKLSNKMALVENGDLDVVVHSASKDEISLLTNRFGKMLKRINELIQEVYQNKIDQQKAEFKALQAQINPHFLYNTLSVIKWKSLQADEQEISTIVASLANFYRTALNKGNNMIPVREEVLNIKSYIQIMLIMKDYRFDVAYEIDEAIYPYEMINLILQPIVENAILHGIGKKTDGRGLLTVTGKCEDDWIRFTVKDNGIGMSAEKIRGVLSQDSASYGLKNVNDRLMLFFGKGCGIEIESEEGRGTAMRIGIPKRPKETAV